MEHLEFEVFFFFFSLFNMEAFSVRIFQYLNVYIYIYIYIYKYFLICLKHCPNFFFFWGCRIHRLLLCRGVRPPPETSVLDMTQNNLMVRFQQCWSFGECGVPLHCHRSQVHSGPGVVAPDKGPIYGLNRTTCFFYYTDFCI